MSDYAERHVTGYASVGLTLRYHPAAFPHAGLGSQRIIPCVDLLTAPTGADGDARNAIRGGKHQADQDDHSDKIARQIRNSD